jgi:hypothetical protein
MGRNWYWRHSRLPIHQPKACPVCGLTIRRYGKHLNQKHPDWQPAGAETFAYPEAALGVALDASPRVSLASGVAAAMGAGVAGGSRG